jgi:hypothetical protein
MRYTFLSQAALRVERFHRAANTRPAHESAVPEMVIGRCPTCAGNLIAVTPQRGSLVIHGPTPLIVASDGRCDDCKGVHAAWAVLDKGIGMTPPRVAACDRAALLAGFGIPPAGNRIIEGKVNWNE